MSHELSYLLGLASALIEEYRDYLISQGDENGLVKMESRYATVKAGVTKLIYQQKPKESEQDGA